MRTRNFLLSALALLAVALLAGLLSAGQTYAITKGPITYTVDNTLDTAVAGGCTNVSTGDCSLREAITEANGHVVTINPPNLIHFAIPGSPPFVISPGSGLPEITRRVTIDGSTQQVSGSPCIATAATAPCVRIDGTNAGGGDGLYVLTSGSTIKGLAITNFFAGDAIALDGNSNSVVLDYVGTADGTTAASSSVGVAIVNGGSGNTIGGTTPAARNVISGNVTGVAIQGPSNTVEGNYIGLVPAGTAALPNSTGISVTAENNTIGGTQAGAGNVVSGNTSDGIGLYAANNLVEGNYVGTNADGTQGIGNGQNGVVLERDTETIGGTTAGARNVISGNRYGIGVSGSNNVIEGNYVGTNAAGTQAIGNAFRGIDLEEATGSTIGGSTAGAGNVISGNTGVGVQDVDSHGNEFLGNFIGTDATGMLAIPNSDNGIELNTSSNLETVGGSDPSDRNIIAANGSSGVYLRGASSNTVTGNYIGLNAAGAALGNGYGVFIDGNGQTSDLNVIAGNVISGNSQWGVTASSVSTDSVTNTQIASDYIGTNVAGNAAIPNGAGGVQLISDDSGQTVSGTVLQSSSSFDLISGNGGDGIELSGPGTTGNLIEDVDIGIAPSFAAIANSGDGIAINSGANANDVLGNYIGYNARGISISGTGTNNNELLGNSIGTLSGTENFGNAGDGVFIGDGAQDNQIGSETAPQSLGLAQPQGDFHPEGPGGNVIWNNGGAGVEVSGADAKFNQVSANSINNNGGLGIELMDGANEGQPPPVLLGAVNSGGSTYVTGTATGPANHDIFFEFFASSSCDQSGSGEGTYYLGELDSHTDATGTVAFADTLTPGGANGQVITATSSNINHETSQFSNCVTAAGPGTPTPTPAPSHTPTPTPAATPVPTASPTPSGVRGDANCDGVVNANDAVDALSELAGVPPGAPCATQADLNCNGHLDGDDALRILTYVAGVPGSTPSGCFG